MNLVLRQLRLEDEAVFLSSLELWKNEDLNLYSFILKENPNVPYLEMLKELNEERDGVNLPDGYVPATMLYAFSDDLIVGRFHVRHSLNDYLKTRGGHAGYAVAPDYRKRGVASQMMRQGLSYIKNELHLEKILITCADSNEGSIKVIEKFGGLLENKVYDEGHKEDIRRYWITL